LGILESGGHHNLSLIINRIRPDLVRRHQMLAPDDILKTLSIDLLGIVPEAEEILVSNNRGVPVAHDLSSLVGKAYQNIARRLLGERVPFIPILEGRRGFLARLGFKNRTSR